jgi:hypothetical protein
MTACDAPKIGMAGCAMRQPEGACPLDGAACGQTPEFGMRRMLSYFARYKLDLTKRWHFQREKLRKMALMVKYPG